jgi:hypothetical protein
MGMPLSFGGVAIKSIDLLILDELSWSRRESWDIPSALLRGQFDSGDDATGCGVERLTQTLLFGRLYRTF